MKASHTYRLAGAAMVLVMFASLASCERPQKTDVKPERTATEKSAEAKRLYVSKQVDRWHVVGSNSGTFTVELSAYECNALFGDVAADNSCTYNHKACKATKGGTTVTMCITEAD